MAKKDAQNTSTSREIVAIVADRAESPVAKAILEFVSRIPESEVPRAATGSVEDECRRLSNAAANKAGLTAGSLALPPGPLGWLTVLPELVAIWRIQGQLVSDIAAAYGKTAKLGREQMLWCLFRHTAAQAFRDIAIRVGDRLVFRTAATSVLQRLAGRIGVSVSKRAVGKGISRWLPIVGALGVGAYAYYDTGQVAKTAMELFSGEIHIEGDGSPEGDGPGDGAPGGKGTGRRGKRSDDTGAAGGTTPASDPANASGPVARSRVTRVAAAAKTKAATAAPRKRTTAKRSAAKRSVVKRAGAPAKRSPASKPAAKAGSAKRLPAPRAAAAPNAGKAAGAKTAAAKKATTKTTARRAPAKKAPAGKAKRATT